MFHLKLILAVQLLAATSQASQDARLQTRQAVTCNQAYITEFTDTCASIIEQFGITQAEFIAWNSFVGADCVDFIPGFAYCVRGVGGGAPPPVGSSSTTTTTTLKASSTTLATSTTTRVTTAAPSPTTNISQDGLCSANGKTCIGSTFGSCCSASGWCGATDTHCKAGCQTAFGSCTGANISIDGKCGANGKTCLGSTFGDCCSAGDWCGTTTDHCDTGCKPAFGKCAAKPITTTTTASKTTTTSAKPTPSSNISTDGFCGAVNGKTCTGSTFGGCCSASNYCGTTFDHCYATGCQPKFGTCAVTFPTNPPPAPTPTNNISQDGKCGGSDGKTCIGSTFGSCCSVGGWCGTTNDFCQVGCQPKFGTCKANNISVDGSCGANGKTCTGSTFGTCCSKTGWCGTGVDFCAQGCQKSSSSACTTTNIPSLTGECGPKNGGFVCAGGPFNGGCCSASGWCGKGAGFCS